MVAQEPVAIARPPQSAAFAPQSTSAATHPVRGQDTYEPSSTATTFIKPCVTRACFTRRNGRFAPNLWRALTAGEQTRDPRAVDSSSTLIAAAGTVDLLGSDVRFVFLHHWRPRTAAGSVGCRF